MTPDVMLVRGVFAAELVDRWLAAVTPEALAAARDPFNRVAVRLPEPLAEIARSREFLDMTRKYLRSFEIGLYVERLVVKDEHSRGPVFLHQDCVYHKGLLNKWSAFVALTESSALNGGLTVYPGTSEYGSLGDAGEIDRAMLEATGSQPWTPTMRPGDVLLMHSATWHESGPNVDGCDRILVDIIVSAGADPFCTPLGGTWGTMAPAALRDPFARCRVSRIRDLEAKLAAVESADAARPEGAGPPDASPAADGDGRRGDRVFDRLVPALGKDDRAGPDADRVGEHRDVPQGVRA